MLISVLPFLLDKLGIRYWYSVGRSDYSYSGDYFEFKTKLLCTIVNFVRANDDKIQNRPISWCDPKLRGKSLMRSSPCEPHAGVEF